MQKPTNTLEVNNKRVINAWSFFDWANSSYALVIAVAIFPNYFIRMTDDYIPVMGMDISNSSLYAFSISLAYVVVAILLPLLSGIADYSGRRKYFLKLFTILGSVSCFILFFFQGMPQVALALICFMLATIGFEGGKVFYNSYLPLISSPDRYDRISAKGFAYGYFGSVILLVTNLIIILNPDWFGITNETLPVRLSFVMVALWWIGFALIPFLRLPQDKRIHGQKDLVRKGLGEIKKVWLEMRPQVNIKRFLLSFFCYSAGVHTVIYLAATFAEKELAFETTDLITVILLLQIVGIGGAYLFAFLSKLRGNKFSIMSMLMIWVSICLMAYFVNAKLQFYVVAGLVGLVMGGIQAMSRSTYSKLIPVNEDDTTSYFSFFEVLEKVAIVFGTFSFGIIDQISGGMRNSVLLLAVYFVLGMIVLTQVKIEPHQAQLEYS